MFPVGSFVVAKSFRFFPERNGEVMKVIGVLDTYPGKDGQGQLVTVFGYKIEAADGKVFVAPPDQLARHIRGDLVTVPWTSCPWIPKSLRTFIPFIPKNWDGKFKT